MRSLEAYCTLHFMRILITLCLSATADGAGREMFAKVVPSRIFLYIFEEFQSFKFLDKNYKQLVENESEGFYFMMALHFQIKLNGAN